MNREEEVKTALNFLKAKGWNVQYEPRTRMYKAESSARCHYVDWIDLVHIAKVNGCGEDN
jgi:hypothetical protein